MKTATGQVTTLWPFAPSLCLRGRPSYCAGGGWTGSGRTWHRSTNSVSGADLGFENRGGGAGGVIGVLA